MNILIVHTMYPEPDTNAGGLRLVEIIKILRQNNHEVTFLAVMSNQADTLRYQAHLTAMGVATSIYKDSALCQSPDQIKAFLTQGAFDVAIVVQFYNYNLLAPYIRAFLPMCSLILDTVDLNFVRRQREAEVRPDASRDAEIEEMRQREMQAIRDADMVWVVTDTERDILRPMLANKGTAIYVIPTLHTVSDILPPQAERSGIVFLGGYLHSPNVDAIDYFMRDIYPPLRRLLPGVPITMAGSHPPPEFTAYAEQYAEVNITGFVKDHRSLLRTHRIGIAPLRYGAGMKGKIGEYLACGLPCVSTTIGVEGMGLQNERDVLVADDAETFVNAIARLYQDPDLWQALSEAGVRYVASRFTPEVIAPVLLDAIDAAKGSVPQKRPVLSIGRLNDLMHPFTLLRLGWGFLGALRRGGLAEVHYRIRARAMRSPGLADKLADNKNENKPDGAAEQARP